MADSLTSTSMSKQNHERLPQTVTEYQATATASVTNNNITSITSVRLTTPRVLACRRSHAVGDRDRDCDRDSKTERRPAASDSAAAAAWIPVDDIKNSLRPFKSSEQFRPTWLNYTFHNAEQWWKKLIAKFNYHDLVDRHQVLESDQVRQHIHEYASAENKSSSPLVISCRHVLRVDDDRHRAVHVIRKPIDIQRGKVVYFVCRLPIGSKGPYSICNNTSWKSKHFRTISSIAGSDIEDHAVSTETRDQVLNNLTCLDVINSNCYLPIMKDEDLKSQLSVNLKSTAAATSLSAAAESPIECTRNAFHLLITGQVDAHDEQLGFVEVKSHTFTRKRRGLQKLRFQSMLGGCDTAVLIHKYFNNRTGGMHVGSPRTNNQHRMDKTLQPFVQDNRNRRPWLAYCDTTSLCDDNDSDFAQLLLKLWDRLEKVTAFDGASESDSKKSTSSRTSSTSSTCATFLIKDDHVMQYASIDKLGEELDYAGFNVELLNKDYGGHNKRLSHSVDVENLQNHIDACSAQLDIIIAGIELPQVQQKQLSQDPDELMTATVTAATSVAVATVTTSESIGPAAAAADDDDDTTDGDDLATQFDNQLNL
jgi:hypothetical protein